MLHVLHVIGVQAGMGSGFTEYKQETDIPGEGMDKMSALRINIIIWKTLNESRGESGATD
jgi:hypothetical protein